MERLQPPVSLATVQNTDGQLMHFFVQQKVL